MPAPNRSRRPAARRTPRPRPRQSTYDDSSDDTHPTRPRRSRSPDESYYSDDTLPSPRRRQTLQLPDYDALALEEYEADEDWEAEPEDSGRWEDTYSGYDTRRRPTRSRRDSYDSGVGSEDDMRPRRRPRRESYDSGSEDMRPRRRPYDSGPGYPPRQREFMYAESEVSDMSDFDSKPLRKRRDLIKPHIPKETSGEALVSGLGVRPTSSEANETFQEHTRWSKEAARQRHKRLSDDRYELTMADKHPTVSSAVNTDQPMSILRNASDGSCIPLSEAKKKLRVAYNHNWSQNHWKNKEVLEEDDKEKAWSPVTVPTMETAMTKQAMTIVRNAMVSMPDSSMTEEEEKKWALKRIQLLRLADYTLEHDAKKLTDDMKDIIKVADSAHVPTSICTMAEDFPTMLKYNISGIRALEAGERSKVTLTTEEESKLEKELEDFRNPKNNFVRQTHVYDAGYSDMIRDHGTLSWASTDDYTKHDHAADVLSTWLDKVNIVCDSVEGRRAYLDNGTGIDSELSTRENIREFLTTAYYDDPVASRDYSTDAYMPSTTITTATAPIMRDIVLSNYRQMYDEIESHLTNPGGEAPKPVLTREWDQGLKTENLRADVMKKVKKIEKSYKDHPNYARIAEHYQNDALKRYHKKWRKAEKTTYMDSEEWAKRYPLLSKHKTYTEARSAGVGREWWHEKSEVPKMNHELLMSDSPWG